jgi:hypothetical protein
MPTEMCVAPSGSAGLVQLAFVQVEAAGYVADAQ